MSRNRIDLSGLLRGAEGRAAMVVESGALIVRDAIVDEMELAPPRTGREYFIPGTKTLYTASAPGEPPAVREAVYRDSWKSTPAVVTGKTVQAAAYSNLVDPDGKFRGMKLEYGDGKVEPRPHIEPALTKAMSQIQQLARTAGS